MNSISTEPANVLLEGGPLPIADVVRVAREGARVALSSEAFARLAASRTVVDDVIAHGDVVYGINTGFGDLSRVQIGNEDLATLQRNLVMSHSAGVGEPLPAEVIRAMMLVQAASLCRGYSGVRPRVVRLLVGLLNHNILPIVPSKGSLGASGDLAPLAHVALVLSGLGEVEVAGERLPAAAVLARFGLEAVELAAKEGLALINGTHLMAAMGALAVYDARVAVESAEVAAAMSLEALRGSDVPFDPRIQAARPHHGQIATAAHMRFLLAGSEIIPSHRLNDPRVQDPYSLRCIPQVIGAVRDTLDHCGQVIRTELQAVTDNPLCFPDEGAILSGGNFHGQPLGMALDFLAIAMAEMGAFAERRIYLLLDDREPLSDRLPPFLAAHPGLDSGYMIAQYVAASLVAENAVLATPAGLHSVPTSAGMEDFVSMGATAGLKLHNVLDNVRHILAIELLCAAVGVEYRRPLRAGQGVEEALERVRAIIPTPTGDHFLQPDIAALAAAVHAGRFAL